MITLGLAGAIGHDPAAALIVDGELVAAMEEERVLRRRHAKNEQPYHAARTCLRIAGIRPSQVDQVAIPFAPISLFSRARWHYAYRHWYAPDRSLDGLFNGNRRYRRYLKDLSGLLEKLHIPMSSIKLIPVEHQLAHASSCYHVNEPAEKTAIFCNDSKGEYASIFLGYGHNGKIVKIKRFYNPDSLCGMYAALTDYLGFEILDGEFRVMGIAPFGDPDKYDLSSLASCNGKDFRVNNRLIGTVGLRRYKAKSKGHYFSKKLVDMLGPRRVGHLEDDPYVHYAAAIQKLYEDIAEKMVRHYLGDILAETGRLAVAGTGSMNIRLNQRLNHMPEVKELIVHPGCSDSGTAIGAATYAARQQSETPLKPVKHFFLGPKFSRLDYIDACKRHRDKPQWEELSNPHERGAQLLAAGELLGWYRGRMEFGPRALGHRCILANPAQEGVVEKINTLVKFRERWRTFSPSILASAAPELLEEEYRDQYMCVNEAVSKTYQDRYPSATYIDGCTRAQIVDPDSNADFHKLLVEFEKLTGHPMLINTTLSRPGEALACTPEHAVDVFMGTDLNYLILEDILVTKREEPKDW